MSEDTERKEGEEKLPKFTVYVPKLKNLRPEQKQFIKNKFGDRIIRKVTLKELGNEVVGTKLNATVYDEFLFRHNGKTFRKVLLALELASSGKDTFFITNHSQHLQHAFRMAAHIVQILGSAVKVKALREIEFPDAFLRFEVIKTARDEDRFRGTKAEMIYDN